MTLSHILTLSAFGESFSDPKLAKRLPGCLLTPYLQPINPIKRLRELHVLIAQQQVKTKPQSIKKKGGEVWIRRIVQVGLPLFLKLFWTYLPLPQGTSSETVNDRDLLPLPALKRAATVIFDFPKRRHLL
jgi:hypothetical protein